MSMYLSNNKTHSVSGLIVTTTSDLDFQENLLNNCYVSSKRAMLNSMACNLRLNATFTSYKYFKHLWL